MSSTLINLVVHDTYGVPIADQPLELQIIKGDGSIPLNTRTDTSEYRRLLTLQDVNLCYPLSEQL